jgi:hypothetical protein
MKLLLEVVLGMVSMLYWVTNQPKVEHFPRASQNLMHREVQVGLDPIPFLACVLAGKASEDTIRKIEKSLKKVSLWSNRRKRGVARKASVAA